MQPQTSLAIRPAQQTALSLRETRANSLAPYLASSETDLARTVLRKFNKLTFATARESAQVSGLTKTDPELADDAAEALANLLTCACSQFNVGSNMSDTQVAILANDMLTTYWYWRFDEFAYVLGQAIRGKYGTTYGKIDAQTVNEWCQKYSADREGLLTLEAEQQAKRYKLAEINGSPAADAPAPEVTTPEALALREQLEALPNEQLQRGLDHYAALPAPTAAESLKLAVATAVAQERNRVAWAAHMLRLFKSSAGKTQAERAAQAKREDHALGVALLRGDWEGAGFASAPSAEWLAKVTAPVNEPEPAPAQHQVFPPACPDCLQRRDRCICDQAPF